MTMKHHFPSDGMTYHQWLVGTIAAAITDDYWHDGSYDAAKIAGHAIAVADEICNRQFFERNTMTTMQEIFDLENRLSVGHVLSIRNSLPPSATPIDYLKSLEEAVAESRAAMMNLKK